MEIRTQRQDVGLHGALALLVFVNLGEFGIDDFFVGSRFARSLGGGVRACGLLLS